MYVREQESRWGNVARTFEDQEVIQRPDINKDPGSAFSIKKHTAGPIEENIDNVVVFECSACVSKWVKPKNKRICAFICRETRIEVRVLPEGDTFMVLIMAKVFQRIS